MENLNAGSSPEIEKMFKREGEISTEIKELSSVNKKDCPLFEPTEIYAADVFSFLHGDSVRYNHTSGKWLYWENGMWCIDTKDKILDLARDVSKYIKGLITPNTSNEQHKVLLTTAIKFSNFKIIGNFLNIAASIPAIAIVQSDLDTNKYLLNCKNGIFDLKNFQFFPHDRTLLLSKQADVNYNVSAICPKFEAFISWACCSDAELVRHLQHLFGLCLSGETVQFMWFFYGLGANGKSVLLSVIAMLLNDYVQKSPFTMLIEDNNSSVRNDLARLVGSRVSLCSEVPAAVVLNESLVKDMTGNDKITARFLYKEYFEFIPTHKLIFAGNHRPRIKGGDEGIWRRLLLVPFDNFVKPEDRRDMNKMLAEFKSESAGILNWAISGLQDFRKNGLYIPEKIKVAVEEYRNSEDLLSDFLEENTLRSNNAQCLFSDLYKRYCESGNDRKVTSRSFSEMLKERGFKTDRGTQNKVIVLGVNLKQIESCF